MKNKILLLIFLLIILPNVVSSFLISDQGTNVREIATGNLTVLANLTISIYDNATGGNLIFEQNFSGAIANGSWNLMINPNLEYGKNYWKDYKINEEDLDFDGNERLEFQSSIGKINNASFINFSRINSCPSGSSIRLIYENGSVECEVDDNSVTPDLTNYALKNQSETFTGNITTTQTGFFGWLGSLISRITKLFVQDIDFNGTINGSGNINITGNISANYFIGNGSLLTNLPAGTESDPIFVAENSTLWNAINSKLAETDQKYNETVLILSINTTSNIMSLSFYNKSEVDELISGVGTGGNSSFNQTLTNTLYYSISNPLNFINSTTGQVFNDTTLILTVNSSLWNYINANNASWMSTYNATYDAKAGTGNCPAGQVVMNTTNSGVQCVTPTAIETEPAWNGNYSIFLGLINNGSYLSTYNATYSTWAYNQTIGADSYTDSRINLINTTANIQLLINNTGIYNQGAGNASWNESYAFTKFAPNTTASIQYLINNTGIYAYTYNQTIGANSYTDSRIIIINNSLGNYALNTTASIQYLINSTGIYSQGAGNSSWNESLAHTLFDSTYNATYDSFIVNVSVNHTLNTINYLISAYNTTWSSTYNATYATNMANNSWNESLAHTLFDSTFNATYSTWAYNQTIGANSYTDSRINLINTTANIQLLINNTGIYNQGAGNASWNESYAFTKFAPNTTAGIQYLINNTGIYAYTYNQTIGANSYTDSRIIIINNSLGNYALNTTASIQYLINSTGIYSQGAGNSSWNESLAHTLFDSTFNSTYDSFISNISTIAIVNATIITVNGTAYQTTNIRNYLNSSTGTNAINLSCTNITGTNANLCTITDLSSVNLTTNWMGVNDTELMRFIVLLNGTTGWIGINDTSLRAYIIAVNGTAYQITNPSNYWNWTTYTNCSSGQYAVNFTREGFQCLTPSSTSFNATYDSWLNNISRIDVLNTTATVQKLVNNSINSSVYFGLWKSFNTTQFVTTPPTVSLLESFIVSLINAQSYTKAETDANLTLRYLESNPSNYWNWTTYTNCSSGQFAVNISRGGFQCLTPVTSAFNATYDALISNVSSIAVVNGTIIAVNGTAYQTTNIRNYLNSSTGTNAINVSCNNVTGAAANLCTITDASIINSTANWMGVNDTAIYNYFLVVNSTSNWFGINGTAIYNKLLTVNSTSSWIGVNDTKLMTMNTTANAQSLINNTNIQFGNISFTGGGYIRDNGTTLILGHN